MRAITTAIVCIFSLIKVFSQTPDSKLKIGHITGDFYVYTTYGLYQGQRIPANGMYVVTDNGIVLIDTPWDTTQFAPLLDSLQVRHHKQVAMCLVTHFHEDRTGGLDYYRQRGVRTFTTRKTDELSQKRGMKRAEVLIKQDTLFTVGQYSFQTYFLGPGHAPDNIVVWFGKEKVLYGGCLVKSVDDSTLGNMADASVEDYEATIQNVRKACRNPRYVITGHGSWADTKSLEHTLRMAQQLKQKQPR